MSPLPEIWRAQLENIGKKYDPRVALLTVGVQWLTQVLLGGFTNASFTTAPPDLKILAVQQTPELAAEGMLEIFVYSETFDLYRPGDQMIDLAFRYEHSAPVLVFPNGAPDLTKEG